MKFGGSLPRNARFEAATCLLSILWFSFAVAVSMGEAAKHLLFEGVEAGWNVSFCVAGVALPDTRTCLQSEVVLRDSAQVRHFGDLHRHLACQALSCCVFVANRIVRAASSGDNVQIPWQAWDIVRLSFCAAPPAAFGEDPSCAGAVFRTLYTLYTLLYTYTLHFTLHTLHFTLHTAHCTLHTQHFPLYTAHFTLYTPHTKLYTPHCTL